MQKVREGSHKRRAATATRGTSFFPLTPIINTMIENSRSIRFKVPAMEGLNGPGIIPAHLKKLL